MSFSGYFRRCKNFFGRKVTVCDLRFPFHMKTETEVRSDVLCRTFQHVIYTPRLWKSVSIVNYHLSQQFLALELTFYRHTTVNSWSDFTSLLCRLFLPVLPSDSAAIRELLLLFCTLIGGTATVRTVGLLGSVSGATHATRGSQF